MKCGCDNFQDCGSLLYPNENFRLLETYVKYKASRVEKLAFESNELQCRNSRDFSILVYMLDSASSDIKFSIDDFVQVETDREKLEFFFGQFVIMVYQ